MQERNIFECILFRIPIYRKFYIVFLTITSIIYGETLFYISYIYQPYCLQVLESFFQKRFALITNVNADLRTCEIESEELKKLILLDGVEKNDKKNDKNKRNDNDQKV